MAKLLTVLVVSIAVAVTASCGSGPVAETPPNRGATPDVETAPLSDSSALELPKERPVEDYPMSDPPRFHVLTEHGQIDVKPWTICASTYCADGVPDDNHLPDVGEVDQVDFGFDLSGWEFRYVTFRELDTDCPRTVAVAATKTGQRTFRITPAGPAGRWAVDIFGRGHSGDAVTTVEWTTRTDGSYGPRAKGVAAVLASHDGRLDSYGVELSLRHLDRWYDDAAASITVSSVDERSVTIPLRAPKRCDSAGDLFLTASEEAGRKAARLGQGPFTYTAKVRLGRVTYTGTGTWPDGVIKGNAPSVRLDWEPRLPGYAARR